MKKMLLALFALLVICVLALAVFLLPQHWQVRSTNTPIPAIAQLLQIDSTGGPVALHYINTSEQVWAGGDLVHSVFVLEWPDGRLLLVDAGMRREQAVAFANMLGGEGVVHGNVGQLLGQSAQRVAGIAFTHLHIDHTEGVVALCDAVESRPLLLQTPLQAQEHNFHTKEGAQILRDSCLRPDVLRGDNLLTSASFPGLAIIPVGGHTPGSTVFAVWVQGQLYVLSGDITNAKPDLLADRGKGWVYSNLLVPEDTQRTAQLRHWLRSLAEHEDITVVVSHDLQDIRSSGLPEFSDGSADR